MRYPTGHQRIQLSILRNIQLAGLDPSRWKLILDQLSVAGDGICVHLFGYDTVMNDSAITFYSGYDPEAMASFQDYYGHYNAWAPGFSRHRVGEIVPAQAMLSDEALRQTEFYHGWIVPQEDIALGGGTILERDHSRLLMIGANIRRKDGEDKQHNWLQMLDALMPFLRAAFETSRTIDGLKFETYLLRQQVDSRTVPIIVLDGQDRLVFCNREGETIIGHGRHLKPGIGEKLRFASRRASEEFARIRRSGPLTSQTLIRLDGTVNPPLQVRVLVLAEEALDVIPFWARGMVSLPLAVLIFGPNRNEDEGDDLASNLGLTRAQADVIRGLCAGKTLEQISQDRGTSIWTVRNQIKVAMERTGTRRQVDLVLMAARKMQLR